MIDEISEIHEVKEMENEVSLALDRKDVVSLQLQNSLSIDEDRIDHRVNEERESMCGSCATNEHRDAVRSKPESTMDDESANRHPVLAVGRPFPRSWGECLDYAYDFVKKHVVLPPVYLAGLVNHPQTRPSPSSSPVTNHGPCKPRISDVTSYDPNPMLMSAAHTGS